MAVKIFLESHEVGASGYGHLYLVLRDDADPEDSTQTAQVIRGGLPPIGFPFQLRIETGDLHESQDSYADTGMRFSIDITNLVGGTNAWGALTQAATGLIGRYSYIVENPSEGGNISNSNATILTVLNSVGVDVRSLIGQLGDFGNGYPGVSYAQNHYGTLLGSGDNPWIVASAAMDDQGLTLYGRRDFDDKMIGTDQDDYFFGNSGNDEVFWGKGNDVYLGGDGKDTYNLEQSSNPVNLTIGYSAGHEAFGLTLAAHIEANVIAGEYSTYTHEVERFVLSGGDDTVSFVGDLTAYSEVSNLSDIEIQAGPQGESGDTLDLQGITSSGDISISLTNIAGTITQGNTTIGNLFGFENVVGSSQDDTINGNGETNRIDGRGGIDAIDGGEGDDVIQGGAGDDILRGGFGQDVVFGGADDDQIFGFLEEGDGGPPMEGEEGGDEESFATGTLSDVIDGGTGSDTLNYGSYVEVRVGELGGEVAIAIGAIGATDIAFNIEILGEIGSIDFSAYQNGITFDASTMNVDIGGSSLHLTDFTSFTGSNGGDTLTASSEHNRINGAGGSDTITGAGNGSLHGGNGSDVLIGAEGDNLYGGAGDDMLTSGGGNVELRGGSGNDSLEAQIGDRVSGDADDTLKLDGNAIGGDDVMFGLTADWAGSSAANDELFSRDYVVMVRPSVVQFGFDGTQATILWEGFIYLNPNRAEDLNEIGRFIQSNADARIYFKLGDFGINVSGLVHGLNQSDTDRKIYGDLQLDGQLVSVTQLPIGNVTGTIADDELPDVVPFEEYSGVSTADLERYYELRDALGEGDSGGGGGPPPNNTNVSSGSGPTTVTTFTAQTSFLVFDGTAINPTITSAGYSVAQSGANVVVDFGGGDIVTLENVSLTDWQTAAGTQYFGSAAGEALTGTSQDEAFTSGAGDDLIIAGSGDDTIYYTSGDDVIKGNKSNYGNDTLDLSQYTADQVSFRIVGHDVFIDTPDGSIELDYQVRYELGHTRSNIENIVFSDGTLDETGIAARAIADQTSAGDDVVTGSYQADTISSGAGNDIIFAGSGDDTIIYTSGDDVIVGNGTRNYGNDTLDLNQYTANQVSFRIVGHDVFIDTPDGTIELDYQVRYELGHTRSNIENIIFSDGTLDEAGIRDRAIADQTSAGDDVVTGSYVSDTISSGAGNDVVNAWYGDDTIVYTSGNDVITGYGSVNYGNDTLDLSQYTADQVSISIVGHDVFIDTPDGTIELDYQVRYEIGHARSNIENIIFSDGTLDEAGIAARAIADQASTDDDVITGSFQSEVITGGAGNDTLSGVSGSDTFVFAVGDGVDVITDYDAANDALEFTGLGFSDLTITQTGSDVLIEYGTGDQVTVAGSLVADFVVDEFVFA